MNPNTDNPIFEDRKELLERQSQEYKNALLGEVKELKEKSQDVGKKVIIAGGALALTFILAKAYLNRSRAHEPQKLLAYKGRKKKKKAQFNFDSEYAAYEDLTDNASAYDISDMPQSEPLSQPYQGQPSQPYRPGQKTDSIGKDIFNVLAHQLTAYLIILGTRKLDEYLNARQTAHDTSSNPEGTYGHSAGELTYTSPAAADIQSAAAE